MDRDKMIEFLTCNEPSFLYNGIEYGICWPGDNLVVWPMGNEDDDQLFSSPEELVDNLKIDGVRFADFADEVFADYFRHDL